MTPSWCTPLHHPPEGCGRANGLQWRDTSSTMMTTPNNPLTTPATSDGASPNPGGARR